MVYIIYFKEVPAWKNPVKSYFPFLVVQASLGQLDFWVSFFPLLVASFHSSLPSVRIALCCLEEGIPHVGFQQYHADDLPALPCGAWPDYKGGAMQLLYVFGLIP